MKKKNGTMDKKLASYDFELPDNFIAQYPSQRRDDAGMMVVECQTNTHQHKTFSQLPEYLRKGDLLVFNDTKVIPARLTGRKETGGTVEVFFLEMTPDRQWNVLLKASRRPKPGTILTIHDTVHLRITEHRPDRTSLCECLSDCSYLEILHRFGDIPLPPYIKRATTEEDKQRYQTVYAEKEGSVAAPTAGLHFTPEILRRLDQAGVERATVTLHVGMGTFRPVQAEHIHQHAMHTEKYEITESNATVIQRALDEGRRIIAVGSTTVKTLEAVFQQHHSIQPGVGETDLFIYPPFSFRVTSGILTNFHLPKSSLLMMMSAFAGREMLLDLYKEAIKEKYRFYSYGDCMLLI